MLRWTMFILIAFGAWCAAPAGADKRNDGMVDAHRQMAHFLGLAATLKPSGA